MKTEIAENVGKHAFEVRGLGLAPFRYVGINRNQITYPDGSTQAGGTCDYCGTGIMFECLIKSADGKLSKVGCNCIEKVGDEGLLKAYKQSPQHRAHQRELARAKAERNRNEIVVALFEHAGRLMDIPHHSGWTDRTTGRPLTAFDTAQWHYWHDGMSGAASTLRWIRKILA